MNEFRVIVDEQYGYRRLEPIPTEKDLETFYSDRYSELIKKGGRAPEMRKLLSTVERNSELNWLKATLYDDIDSLLRKHLSSGNRLLDVGCGTGDLISFLKDKSWQVTGIEPSSELSLVAQTKGLNVCNVNLEAYLAKEKTGEFDVITLLNVLEHVPHPSSFISNCKKMLKKGGILVIRVPNDFTEIQNKVEKTLGKKSYWVTVPDHINYFNLESLSTFLEAHGLKIVEKITDFPMEFFLLMGDNYLEDPIIGKNCHARMVNFELNVGTEARRRIYGKLAELGIGRTITVFATS